MKYLPFILFTFSLAHAGCELAATNFISKRKDAHLTPQNSVVLLPHTTASGGYFNRWKFRVEIFFLSETERDSALILHADKCHPVEIQELVAKLD